MISEATLGRHLASLNQILSEFDYLFKMDVGEVQSIRFAISISVFSARSGPVRNGKAICRNQRETGDCQFRRNLWCKLVFGAEVRLGSLVPHQSTASSGQCLSVQVIEEKCEGIFDNIFYLRLLRKAPSFLGGNTFL